MVDPLVDKPFIPKNFIPHSDYGCMGIDWVYQSFRRGSFMT